jgi:hypothetical protein
MAVLGWLWRRRFADLTLRKGMPRGLVDCLPAMSRGGADTTRTLQLAATFESGQKRLESGRSALGDGMMTSVALRSTKEEYLRCYSI